MYLCSIIYGTKNGIYMCHIHTEWYMYTENFVFQLSPFNKLNSNLFVSYDFPQLFLRAVVVQVELFYLTGHVTLLRPWLLQVSLNSANVILEKVSEIPTKGRYFVTCIIEYKKYIILLTSHYNWYISVAKSISTEWQKHAY